MALRSIQLLSIQNEQTISLLKQEALDYYATIVEDSKIGDQIRIHTDNTQTLVMIT